MHIVAKMFEIYFLAKISSKIFKECPLLQEKFALSFPSTEIFISELIR